MAGAPSQVPKATDNFMMKDTVTEEEFLQICWPRLSTIVGATLALEPGEPFVVAVKQANLYRGVYRCVTSGHAALMFTELSQLLTNHCQTVVLPAMMAVADADMLTYLTVFRHRLRQYAQSTLIVNPIFEYMERTHLKANLDTDWITETETIFRQTVVEDVHIRPRLFAHLNHAAQADPALLDPAAMLCLAQRLHRLNPHYTNLAPTWFGQYIPKGWTYTDPECVTELTTLPTFIDAPHEHTSTPLLEAENVLKRAPSESDMSDGDDDIGSVMDARPDETPTSNERKHFRSQDVVTTSTLRPR
eukprot:m.249041 g.249041  ORF g.249041 m.249041 type:complete len:303 (+) comp17506_c1_seq1:1715-2623(+)